MQTENIYLQKAGESDIHLGKFSEGYTFLFKGTPTPSGIRDLRSWHRFIKVKQEQGFTLYSDFTQENLTLKELLLKILEAGKGKQHAVINTTDGWRDRVGNSFCGGFFK